MSDLTGRTLGQYQLLHRIDDRGSTLIYKAFQPSMSRFVAFKILKPGLARNAAASEQFLQQSELVAKMEHPYILPVYDYGMIEGSVYRASRYVETGTLSNQLVWTANPLNALQLVGRLAEALSYIHGQGYIHGNLKPSNIFLDDNRDPLLTDFGLIHRLGAQPSAYMSPEQVQGKPLDARTDVYSLGVLLYEMLVGDPPPMGMVVSPRAKRPDLPVEVDRVIFTAMAQDPEERFQTAQEFRHALDLALHPAIQVNPPPEESFPEEDAPEGLPLSVVFSPPPDKASKGTPTWAILLLIVILGAVLLVCTIALIVLLLNRA